MRSFRHFRPRYESLPQARPATLKLILCYATCTPFSTRPSAKKNEPFRSLIHRCRSNINTLISQNDKRLTFPELFTPTRPTERSPLYWRQNSIDLNELLTAFDLDEAIGYIDGRKASMTDVVASFEQFLNVKLGDSREAKRVVLKRKIKLTAYLDKLRQLLLKNC